MIIYLFLITLQQQPIRESLSSTCFSTSLLSYVNLKTGIPLLFQLVYTVTCSIRRCISVSRSIYVLMYI